MRLLITFLFVVSYTICFSQYPKYKSIHYSTLNGLPDNSITSIVQDTRGFLWIGTSEGLSRFDGTNFKNYFAKKKDSFSLPGNTIADLNEYKPGKLLFQCDAKIVMMNTVTQQFVQYPGLKGKMVFGLRPAPVSGFFAFGIDTCFVLDKNIEIVEKLIPPLQLKNNFVSAAPLDNNTLLIGSRWEYFFYDLHSKKYTPCVIPIQLPLERRFFVFQYFDPVNKHLYFSNYWSGIYRCSMNGELLYHWENGGKEGLINSNISFIKPRTENTLWVGTLGAGLCILNTSTNQLQKISTENGKSDAVITAHYTDKLKNEWIGTKEGLLKLSAVSKLMNAWKEEFNVAGPGYSLLNITKGSDNQMYLGLFGSKYAFRINTATNSVTQLENRKLPFAWSLNSFGNEIIFTGAGPGITKYDPLTNRYGQTDFLKKYFPNSETVILAFKHSNGDEWFSGNNGGGLLRLEPDGSIHHYTKSGPNAHLSMNYYAVYAEDKNGNLWFGVNKTDRLLKWDRETDRFSEVLMGTVTGTKGEFFLGVTDLALDSSNNLWIAFDGSGLVKYDIKANEAVQYSIENGLPTNYINSLKFDGNNRLWIGTPKGLSCLIVNEKRFARFTKEDGLPEDIFTDRCIYYDSTANRMWVGSLSSLMSFNPDSLVSTAKTDLPVFIDEVIVNGKYQYPDDSSAIYYQASQTNFQFHFTGVDMNNGKNIEYSYKLDGADKEWVYGGSNTIVLYPNLNSGHYTFYVRARHKGENKWSTMHSPFVFVIKTPWFKTWWFRSLLIASFAFLVWYILRFYYSRKLEKQKRLIEKELIIQEERTRVSRELHDSLGSMLSGIKHSFSAMENQLALEETQQLKFHNNIDKLNESIKELRSISHSMASGSLLLNDLENALKDYCHNLHQQGELNISFTALHTQNIQLTQEQTLHLFRIVQELLQNIINHSGATQAILQVSYNSGRLYIAVDDNGRGFEMNSIKQKKGIGLKNIETRIKILKGRLDYQTAPLKGTSVLIEIPCGEK
jgi:ligand-binding sensor domain-containing protein/two-component sensor histidine kinase